MKKINTPEILAINREYRKLHNLIEVDCEVCECKVKKRRWSKHILTTKHLENLKGEKLKCVLGWSILEIILLFFSWNSWVGGWDGFLNTG